MLEFVVVSTIGVASKDVNTSLWPLELSPRLLVWNVNEDMSRVLRYVKINVFVNIQGF